MAPVGICECRMSCQSPGPRPPEVPWALAETKNPLRLTRERVSRFVVLRLTSGLSRLLSSSPERSRVVANNMASTNVHYRRAVVKNLRKTAAVSDALR